MVKRFFESTLRFATLLVVFSVAVWGGVQMFVDLPHKALINSWMALGFTAVVVYHIKDLAYDLGFWGREIKKTYNGQE